MKSSRQLSPRATPRPEPLTVYEVAEHGTISDPTVPLPKIRADVFHIISPSCIRTIDELISAVESCALLAGHFSVLAADHLSDIEDELDAEDNALGFVERRRLAFLVAALRDAPEAGWRDWVEHEGDPGLAGFKEIMQKWLDEGIDWDEADSFGGGWSGQGAALGFFSDLDAKVLQALGVVIIEGEHPGSSYYAAELRDEIANANQTAQALGLACRFRAEDQGAAAEPAWGPVVAVSKGASV